MSTSSASDDLKVALSQMTPASLFEYKPKMTFDTRIISQTEYNGVTVTVLRYPIHYSSLATNLGGRAVLTLVSPTGSGRFADILAV